MMIGDEMQAVPVPLQQARAEAQPPTSMEDAARQFEGLLLGMVLKDSLRDVFSETSDGSGMQVFQEHCVEQVAATLAEQGSLGIADALLEQFEGVGHVRPGGGVL